MKLFNWGKDGGPESTVSGFWFIEIKSLFSIVLLRFDGKSREAFHSHAFNSISWLLKGALTETLFMGVVHKYFPSIKPIITKTTTFHKVDSDGVTWVISFRGPWQKNWCEFSPALNKVSVLKNGRIEEHYN